MKIEVIKERRFIRPYTLNISMGEHVRVYDVQKFWTLKAALREMNRYKRTFKVR